MKVELKALSALKDKTAETITAEDLTAVNQELQSQGFNVQVVTGLGASITQEDVDAAVSKATEALNATVNDLNAKITSKDTEIQNHTASIQSKDAEILRLKGLAHGDPEPPKGGDQGHQDRDKPSAFDGLKERAKVYAKQGAKK